VSFLSSVFDKKGGIGYNKGEILCREAVVRAHFVPYLLDFIVGIFGYHHLLAPAAYFHPVDAPFFQ
jgi:hypothetical protein